MLTVPLNLELTNILACVHDHFKIKVVFSKKFSIHPWGFKKPYIHTNFNSGTKETPKISLKEDDRLQIKVEPWLNCIDSTVHISEVKINMNGSQPLYIWPLHHNEIERENHVQHGNIPPHQLHFLKKFK